MDSMERESPLSQDFKQVEAKGMAGLSGGFYAVAHQLTLHMLEMGLREGGTCKYTAAVVTLLHACLEAYINEFLAFNRQLNPKEIEPKVIELGLNGRVSLEDKWYRTPLLFGGITFEKGAEPFQSFRLLISLRNVLGHYDAKFRTKTEFPSKKVASLRAKFPFSYPGAADWTSQVLNYECARWGCRTVKALIPKFHEFVKGIDFSSTGRPWAEPP